MQRRNLSTLLGKAILAMKALAILAAGVILVAAGSFHASASARPVAVGHYRAAGFLFSGQSSVFSRSAFARDIVPAQAAPTATPTETSAPPPTATPTPTATGPTYPDAQTVLDQAVNVLAAVKTVHFDELATQSGAVNFNIQAIGDASCTPALSAKVTAKQSVPGTQQSATHKFSVIQYKNKIFWKTKKTKNVWQPTKANTVSNFGYGFLPEFPLICPNLSTGTGTGTGGTQNCPTEQPKDLTNVGPDSVNGAAVWHLHLTNVLVDCQGNTSELPEDIYVDQHTHLIYKDVLSFSDESQGITGALSTSLSKFGEKVKIKAPKAGSAKP
jgi:hypothetical protein